MIVKPLGLLPFGQQQAVYLLDPELEMKHVLVGLFVLPVAPKVAVRLLLVLESSPSFVP